MKKRINISIRLNVKEKLDKIGRMNQSYNELIDELASERLRKMRRRERKAVKVKQYIPSKEGIREMVSNSFDQMQVTA